jgi:hypothetical protein
MKQRLQTIGRPVVLALTIALLGLTAVFPILNPALPCSDDAAFHLFRLVQLDSLLRDGVLYCRWAPDMAQGYGNPFFNFYAPLSYYAGALISAVVGNLNLGLRLTFALAIVGGGWAAYLLARDYFSRPAALVAAVAYMYAPYQGYDIYFRGNLAESAAWPLLPLALWAMGRLIRQGSGKWLAVTAVTYAAILLTHNVFALIFSPLLALYALFLTYQAASLRTTQHALHQNSSPIVPIVKSFIPPLVALLLGLGLAAFFWLPAMMEQELVHSDRLLVPPVFVYWNNFVTLAELFALPRLPEPNLLNPSPPRTIGLVAFLLALPAFWWSVIGKRSSVIGRRSSVIGRRSSVIGRRSSVIGRRSSVIGKRSSVNGYRFTSHESRITDHRSRITDYGSPITDHRLRITAVRFFGLALFVYLFMMTAVSQPIWEALPLIEFVQFPWRLLGPAAVCVAFLAAATIDLLPFGRRRLAGGGMAIALLILSVLFWFHPRHCPGLAQPTIADMQAFERDTDTIGTTARGEYLPRQVVQMPRRPAAQPFALPDDPAADLAILSQERRGVTYRASVTAGQPTTVTVNSFVYPGWQAEVNGTAVSITPSPTYGLITFPVPAGQHELTVTFGETPLRRTANGVSLLSLLVTLGLLGASGRWQVKSGKWKAESESLNSSYFLPLTSYLLLAILLFALSHTSLLQQTGLPVTADSITFHNGMRLLDTRIEEEQIRADGSLLLRFYWDALTTPEQVYQTNVVLVDASGLLWSPRGTTPPRIFRSPPPTNQWPLGHYAADWQVLEPLPGTPPGDYQLRLALFERDTERLVGVVGGGPDLPLGQLTITRPAASLSPAAITPQYTADTAWEALRLVGYNLDRNTAVPGDPFLLTLFWQATTSSNIDWQVRLTLQDKTGRIVLTRQLPPVTADFPTGQWQIDDLWRGQHLLRLPAALESGPHTWQLQLCQPNGSACTLIGQPLPLGDLMINAPERSFSPPALTHTTETAVGEITTLLGAIIDLTTAETLPVELIWRAEAETAVSYRVFLHLVGPDGALITQSDGEPAQWQRPTTGWLPGEIIRDSHQLHLPADLPPGHYTLLVGLYDPVTGERLLVDREETAVVVATLTID